jgi:predicted NBD/HSP70 family sugar kinase
MSRATVSSIVADLVHDGLIHETGTADGGGKVGRPGSVLTLDPASGAAVGIDVDHDRLRVIVTDRCSSVLAESEEALELDHDARAAMALAAEMVRDGIGRAAVDPSSVLGVGMALAGPIDLVTGRANPSSISPSWVGIDVAAEMTAQMGYPVVIDNDANLGALAELMFGAARGASEAAYVWLDTGVGAALIVHGEPYRGALGTAGEIGHSTIDEDGPVCRCGNRGCLERAVGTPALLGSLRGSHGDLTVVDMLALAGAGDIGCRRVIADAGRLIGVQIGNLCNLLNPERVIIGGSLSAAGDLLLDPIRDSLARSALPAAASTARVVVGELGDRATVLGASSLVVRQADPLEPGIVVGPPPAPIRPEGSGSFESSERFRTVSTGGR